MNRILVAVDDSPPALAAAALATEIAGHEDAQIHFVAVTEPDHPAHGALRHVTALAQEVGLAATSTAVGGDQPFEALLAAARDWEADLIVMGLSDRRRPGAPHVGSQTEHLLEFTHVPVLVVPYQPRLRVPD